MKRIYFFLSVFLFCFFISNDIKGQVLELESFESGGSFPNDYSDWNTGLPPFSLVEGLNPCDGDWSLEVSLFTNNPIFLEYISSDLTTGFDIDISFQYDIIDNVSSDPVTGNFGTIDLSYTTDGGTTWTIFDTLDQNDLPTQECSSYSFTLPSSSVPANSTFGFRLDATWNTGDYTIAVDDFRFIEQVDCIEPVNVTVDESSITYTEATISWDDLNNPSSGNWTVGYCIVDGTLPDNDPIGFCETVNVTGTPEVDLTALTPGQPYYVYVRSNCGGANGSSEWTPVTTFQTLAIGSTCDVPIEMNALSPSNPLPYQSVNETVIFGNYIGGFPGGSCGASSALLDGYEVVYRYVSDTDDILTIDLTNLDPGVNAGVFVYEDCSDIGLRCIGGGSASGGSNVNLNSVFVDQGEDYYIVIASSNNAGEPLNTNYRLYVDGFDCSSWEQPDTDAILQFVSGQNLSSFSSSPMGVTTTISGATLTWYEDDGGVQGQEITSPLNTIMLQDGDSFWVSQNIFGCESPLVQVTFDEFNCNTDLSGITTTLGGQVCDEGTVTLNAAGGTDNLFWYDSEFDGELVGSGTAYTTPSITETTSYWVSEGFIGLEELSSQANPGPISSSSSSNNYGLTFNSLQPFDIVSVQVYVTGASGLLSLQLEDENGSILETSNVYVAGGTTNNPTLNTLDLFWEVTGTGTYKIIKNSGPSMLYESSGNTNFPYELGDVGSITSGATTSSTSTNYYYFFNWTITNPAILCEGSRTEVEATVNETQPVLVNTSDLYVCLGDSAFLDATSNDQDYTYQWEWQDGDGSHTDTGANIEVFPIENTTYIVTGTNPNTTCSFTEEIEVYVTGVSEVPIALSQAKTELCLDDVSQLLGGGLSYNFEETISDWTTTNQSTSEIGNAGTANWELVQSPGPAGITSNDGSQFYLTRGDLLGPQGVSNSALESPPINLVGVSSATLSFYHYYRDRWNYRVGTNALVQVSVNQGSWETLRTYGDVTGVSDPENEGEPTNFTYDTIDLSSYTNYSNVRIRFLFEGDWGWYWAIDNVVIEKEYLDGEITWSPVTDLYFDEEGTQPYDGTASSNVYFMADAAGQYTYTATLSYQECNDATESITFDVLDPSIPQGDANQLYNLGETIGDLEVTGSNLTWYIMNAQGQLQEVGTNVLLQDGESYYVTQTVGSCESDYLEITTSFECPIPEGIEIDFTINDQTTTDVLISWNDPVDVEGIVDYHLVILDSNNDVIYEEYISSEESYVNVEDLPLDEEFTLQINSVCNYDPENISPDFELNFDTELLGIDLSEQINLNYYPNPTKDIVFFESSSLISSVEVYSITGQRVLQRNVEEVNNTQVDFSNLASGVYFVNLRIENREQVIRIIRE